MLINELPDDCMLAIFDQFDNLYHLMACYKVCLKWSHLIAQRIKKVKYFLDYYAYLPDYSPDYVFYRDRDLIDLAVKFEDIVAFVRNHESLKGIITYSLEVMEQCCDKLEMLATKFSEARILRNCSSMKQLHINDYTLDDFERAYCNNKIWSDLKRTLMKYPNLKHLSLRSPEYITDEHIKQLVNMLPNLVIFDVSRCDGVTQRAADYVANYCKRNDRSTKFYFNGNRHEIQLDWPWLSTKIEKISRGFDFMKHCFLKDFHHLPCFLVPIDY
uniref:F-box domain-containing protein n=1 Tax=Tetranychus urticae TaxID=32264 RepID=T1K8V0_TETUR